MLYVDKAFQRPNSQQRPELPLVRIRRLENAVLHATGHRDLLGEVLLGLHHGIFDLVVGLHLDDDILQAAIGLFALEDEVGVVAPDGARVRVDVLDEEVCWRRFKIEPPCRLNFEPGLMANL